MGYLPADKFQQYKYMDNTIYTSSVLVNHIAMYLYCLNLSLFEKFLQAGSLGVARSTDVFHHNILFFSLRYLRKCHISQGFSWLKGSGFISNEATESKHECNTPPRINKINIYFTDSY